MPATFELKKAKNGQFFFNLKASNGEVILTSEMYKEKRSAKNGIASVQKNGGDAKRYEKKTNKGGKPFFVLKAGNNQVIGQSEAYESEKSRDAGISSVMKAAAGAKLSDTTA
jgi:hypothetical protein